MCLGGSPPKDRSAEIAREEERKRQERITQGRTAIDDAFKGFDDGYFNNFRQSYLDVYNPQVDEQFGDARQEMRYNLQRRGVTNSTTGFDAFGDLTESYGDQRRAIASNADSASNKIRSDVERNKTDLYSINLSAADPSLAAIQAVGRAGSIQSTPEYSPLGDLFSGLVNGTSAVLAGQQNRLPASYRPYFYGGSGSGSGRVVN